MPILDHFHPPLDRDHSWASFHSSWATRLADALTDVLPAGYIAEEITHAGAREIDVAVTQPEGGLVKSNGPAVATAPPQTYAPPAPALVMPVTLPEGFEVRVFSTAGGRTLVGAIELVSLANKDRPETRLAFATKVASFLYGGVSVIVVDIVTSLRANLHNETMRVMAAGEETCLPADIMLYAIAYRPVACREAAEVEMWTERLRVGGPLPTLPLRLRNDLFVPVDFDATYHEACRRRRLA